MSDQQAYAGQADQSAGMSEWNRLDFAMRSVMNKMATMTLVKVVAAHGQTVDVRPLVAQLDGAGNALEHGTIHNVPCWRYQAGAAAIILDPTVGDIGMAVFAHSDISSVKATSDAAPPGSKRRFDWADAIYLGGVLNGQPDTFVRLSGSGVEIVAPTVSASASLTAGTGATGSFSTTDGKVLTVVAGIITGIA